MQKFYIKALPYLIAAIGILGLLISLTSCVGTMPLSPKEVVFKKHKETPLARHAVDIYPDNSKIEVRVDTSITPEKIDIDLYTSCHTEVYEIQASITSEANASAHYYSERNCEPLAGDWYAGGVLVLTRSVHSKEWEWVSCNALFSTPNPSPIINAAKEFITISQNAPNGDYIFTQK